MLKKLTLGTKLIGGFVIVSLIALAIGINGWRGLDFGISAQDELAKKHLQAVFGQGMLMEAIVGHGKVEVSLLLPGLTAAMKDRLKKELVENQKLATEGFKIVDAVEKTETEKADWTRTKEGWDGWKKEHEKVLSLLSAGNREAAVVQSLGPCNDAFDKAMGLLDKWGDETILRAKTTDNAFDEKAVRSKWLTGILVSLGVVLSLVIGIFLATSTSRSLIRAVASLSEGSMQVAAASGQLSSSSQGLAEGSSEQAASLEETSSAMEEMAAMTKQNAGNAVQAKSLADRAGYSVEKSNASMQSLVTSMAEISKMGEETGKIIKTIDEIAFQTNLLALNAAVEAARAGEAGAGFAVVADEVRNLAQRAAGAAKNTSELIEGTIKKIKDGTALVEKTNVDFGEVAAAVTKMTALVGEISAASEEQSRGIGEVSGAVSQMDKVTQSNAANAEEIASASEEMNAQALSLEEIVRSLEAMVHGAGAARGASPAQGLPRARVRAAAAKPKPDRKAAFAAAPGGGMASKGNGRAHPAAAVSPEAAIPLEDEGMATF